MLTEEQEQNYYKYFVRNNNIERMLFEALDRNMIVYNSDAPYTKCTESLIKLMVKVYILNQNNEDDVPARVLLSPSAYYDLAYNSLIDSIDSSKFNTYDFEPEENEYECITEEQCDVFKNVYKKLSYVQIDGFDDRDGQESYGPFLEKCMMNKRYRNTYSNIVLMVNADNSNVLLGDY